MDDLNALTQELEKIAQVFKQKENKVDMSQITSKLTCFISYATKN